MSYQYDLSGQRTRITWPDTLYAQYSYDNTGEITAISENGSTSLATYAYNDLGQRASITRGNGVTTTYSYDGAQRLSSLAHDLASTGSDQTISYTYNAANQALTHTGTNSSYVYTPPTGYLYGPVNGLNQITSLNTTSTTNDSRGNLTNDGTTAYTYDAYNRLTGAGTATLSYDPAGRLYQTAGASTTRFLYDGVSPIAEYNSSGTLLRRYVDGPGIDEPIVWYEGTGTTDRRWLVANEQNSVIAVTNSSGAALKINTYDEYGVPGSSNAGRFQYTGQMWLPEASLYHYKTRAYSPAFGRFMQTDPIGQSSGLNIYAYVDNDPVNLVDPLGACEGPPMVSVDALPQRDFGGDGCPPGPITPPDIPPLPPGPGPIPEPGDLPPLPHNHINQSEYFNYLLPYWAARTEFLGLPSQTGDWTAQLIFAGGPGGARPQPQPPDIQGGPWEPAGPGQQEGTFFGPRQPSGPRAILRWVPPDARSGSQGYWKSQSPGQNGWSRFNSQGEPITPEQAHPGNPQTPNVPLVTTLSFWGVFFTVLLWPTPAE